MAALYGLARRVDQTSNPTSQTPNIKLQTPEKLQCSSSKPPTSLEELGFGHWDFFGAWSLVFGVFIPVFGAWCLVFSLIPLDNDETRMTKPE
jgi:hypothetical protein